MMRYKVKTDNLRFHHEDDVLTKEGGFYYGGDQNDSIRASIVEGNPEWFEKLQEWQVIESMVGGLCYVTNGDVTIKKQKGGYFFAFEREEAEKIAEVLNNKEEL